MASKKIQVLSPDGITIDFKTPHYRSNRAAKAAYTVWAGRFTRQGYYSSSRGRVSLQNLEQHCSFTDLNKQ